MTQPTLKSSIPSFESLVSQEFDQGEIVQQAVSWAILNGAEMRLEVPGSPNLPAFTHAPFALLPSPFPRKSFELVKGIQQDFNLLVHKISLDHEFLEWVAKDIVQVDDFTGALWKIYEQVHREGISQPISLGIHRSDYLLHAGGGGEEPVFQQVELNTIASSFSSLSSKIGDLHRFMLSKFNLPIELPENKSLNSLADGIAQAFKLYGNPNAVVVMVVQPGERNVLDQRWIEFDLLSRHRVPLLRRTLKDLAERGRLDEQSKRLSMFAFFSSSQLLEGD